MKREPNNEMDLFLRKLVRESKTSPVSEGNETSEAATEKHLDADEMNAYAENALPVSTRARYTEHLADCTRCRQIVSQLSLAAGIMVTKTPAVTSTPSGLKAFLSSLFSPMVLRYAVPAVTLLAFASIGFFVLRSPTYQLARRSPEGATQVAQNQPESSPAFVDRSSSNTNTKVATDERVENKAEAQRGLADDSQSNRQNTEKPKPQSAAVDQIQAESAPANTKAIPGQVAETVTVQEQPVVSHDKVAQQKVEPATSSATANLTGASDDQAAKAPAKVAKEKESEKSANRSFGYAVGGVGGPSNTKNEVNAARSRVAEEDAPINGRRDVADKFEKKADKDEKETRSVAGRRFRKEGSMWVDTAFDSSKRTVKVARDSEQYRSLVADEPEIKTIAEQLSGEVIVVWKGTAYRIR
jgi:hypothetical protein